MSDTRFLLFDRESVTEMLKGTLRAAIFVLTVVLLALLAGAVVDMHLPRAVLAALRLVASLSFATAFSAAIWLGFDWARRRIYPRSLAIAIAILVSVAAVHTLFLYAWTVRYAWHYAGPESALAAALVPVRAQCVCEARLRSEVISAEREVYLSTPQIPAGFEVDDTESSDSEMDTGYRDSVAALLEARHRLRNYELALGVWIGLITVVSGLSATAYVSSRRETVPEIKTAAETS